MKILFVVSYTNFYNFGHSWSGVSILSSVLKLKGYDVDIMVVSMDTTDSFIKEYVDEFQPDIIGFSAVYSEYSPICRISRFIKKAFPNVYMIVGGVHSTLCPEEVILDGFDALCVGEGEYPMVELVEQLQQGRKPSGIKNLWFNNGGEIERNATRDFIQDLDNLPLEDIEIWKKWGKFCGKRGTVLISRGCQYECYACCNHALKKVAGSSYVRFKSSEKIIREVENLNLHMPDLKFIYFISENIGYNYDISMDLFKHLEEYNKKRKNAMMFGVDLRFSPTMDYDSFFPAMKAAGFRRISLGVESGCDRVRRESLNRYYTNSDIILTEKKARECGILVTFFIMIGIPGETLYDFQQTLEFLRIAEYDNIAPSIFFPYPGTILYDRCIENNLFSKNEAGETGYERITAFLDLPGFSTEQILRGYEKLRLIRRGCKIVGLLPESQLSPFMKKILEVDKKH